MINSIILVVVIILLILMISTFVMTFTNARTVSQIMEYNEAEYARQEMLERTVGVDETEQKDIVKVLMHCARNKIGTAIVIEGKTLLDHIEESGDKAGLIAVNEQILKTLVESKYTNRGAILIRKNHIIAVNGEMRMDEARQEENRQLINIGLGRRHLGAFGEVMNNPGTVALVVSEETGKISLFGHLSGKLTADVSLDLKEFSIRGGVSQSELEYRLNDLLVGQGLEASLESEELLTDIARKKETPEQRKARKKREKEVARIKREEEKERKRLEREQQREEERRAKSKTERGRFYDSNKQGTPDNIDEPTPVAQPDEESNNKNNNKRPRRRRRR